MYCLIGVTQKVLPICRFLYTVFSVLPARCHTKGPTKIQVLIYGFLVYCLPDVTQIVLPICRFLYTVFSVLLSGVTQKVLRIYRFLYKSFYCIVYQVSHKKSYQSTGSYIRVLSVLSTRCHTKGPSNLQVLISGFIVYCLPGVTQKVIPIYRLIYMGF